MQNQGLVEIVTASLTGSLTSYFVSLKRNRIKTIKDTILHFGIGFTTIFPAWVASKYLNLDPTSSMVVGYVFGILGERIVDYIYQQQNKMFDVLLIKGKNEQVS
jgi:hypothetical protein